MNYFRGSGMSGLCAIKSKSDLTNNIKKPFDSIKTSRITTIDKNTISTTNKNSRR